jgi:hypothetical protein
MLKAAELWARVGNEGKPTADNKSLDGDVILAAQAILVANYGHEVIVATSNAKHLGASQLRTKYKCLGYKYEIINRK